MRSEKCCTSVILLHQKSNPPHLCFHPTFAFQKGAAGMLFLHIYMKLKAVNEHVNEIIMADLRPILDFEIISDSLITAVLTWQQMNMSHIWSVLDIVFNRLIMCFSRLAATGCKWFENPSYFMVYSSQTRSSNFHGRPSLGPLLCILYTCSP